MALWKQKEIKAKNPVCKITIIKKVKVVLGKFECDKEYLYKNGNVTKFKLLYDRNKKYDQEPAVNVKCQTKIKKNTAIRTSK